MDSPFLVAGLGNPGSQYAATRHNVGFRLVEQLVRERGGDWGEAVRQHCRLASAAVAGRKVWVCEPQTYMNDSGLAVRAVMDYYRIPVGQVLVVSDDADLPLGELRMRPGGGPGGHHGLESVEHHLGVREYARLRVGIGRQAPERREITGHVLGVFAPEEARVLSRVLERGVAQVECWIEHGVAQAMNRFNGKIAA